ncbi:MAG: rod shape-determining protein RodA [Alphaproteobacteria bacterium]|nr:rod shape-determining protein RodA [Alphaproteobacteria bacterium]
MKIKLKQIPLLPLLIIVFLLIIALLSLYSLLSSGGMKPYIIKQITRIVIGFIVMYFVLIFDIKLFKKYAYLLYFGSLLMLVVVAMMGRTAMGAQRWLNLYYISVQPSEAMRISLIIALAKYFSCINNEDVNNVLYLIFPSILVLIPTGLVLQQPDLGTAMLLLLVYFSILFIVGLELWKLLLIPACGLVLFPIIWQYLHEYQKNRILMFLVPENDPNGAGYHIIQSKIAIGSGGIWGQGFMKGSQCQLNFLPEKHNDFIFAAIAEEFGFVGCITIIVLYLILLVYNYNIVIQTRNKFYKYLVFGLNSMFFFYIFINISMVCGLLPVVGIPLPFLSYGGSALVVLMFSEAIIMSVAINNKKLIKY